ncbi:MAG: hypothetical protein MZV63_06500 [Marinilabiliales bacterium]|nr:hypothetical protein [Marinilabiliales bacterium]
MLIMWGFVLLFIGTVLSTLDHWFVPFLKGDVYLAVRAASWTWPGSPSWPAWPGVPAAFRAEEGQMQTVERDHVVLGLLFFLALTGFLVEGFRLDAAPPPWAEPSPVGMWIAAVSGPLRHGGSERAPGVVVDPRRGEPLPGGVLPLLQARPRLRRRREPHAGGDALHLVPHPRGAGGAEERLQLPAPRDDGRVHAVRPVHRRLPEPRRG